MQLINKGKIMIIIVIVSSLTLSIILLGMDTALLFEMGYMEKARYGLIQGFVRFVLTCLLFSAIYKGHRWARILSIVLFGLAGILALIIGAHVESLYMNICSLIYFINMIILMSVPVKMFQKYKKHGIINND